jgi:hypothetical protein
MTEEEWLSCTELKPLLAVAAGNFWTRHLLTWLGRPREQARQRRLRLFICACWRAYGLGYGGPAVFRTGIEVAEGYADGLASRAELAVARKGMCAEMDKHVLNWEELDYLMALLAASVNILDLQEVYALTHAVGWQEDESEKLPVSLLRDIFGSCPFRPPPPLPPRVRAWQEGTIGKLAQAAYEERLLPAGFLDSGRLTILADAVEDAGGSDVALLNHLRGRGPHARGCWAVDVVRSGS